MKYTKDEKRLNEIEDVLIETHLDSFPEWRQYALQALETTEPELVKEYKKLFHKLFNDKP